MITITNSIMIIGILLWVIWDIYLFKKIKEDKSIKTISMIITGWSWYTPAIPFAVGFLCGHWFWPA